MIRCNKCKIEKEDNNFHNYWHSTHQKHYTRKECIECYSNQKNERRRLKRKEAKLNKVPTPIEIIEPVVPELEIEVSIPQEDILIDRSIEKRCNTCKEVKPLEQYYRTGKNNFDGRSNRCVECETEKSKKERLVELQQNGGSGRHYEDPNRYYDEYQKEATFNILLAIGWTFNEDKGIWWKEGIKTEDGEFLNLIPKDKKIFTRKRTTDEERDLIIKMYLEGNYKNDIAEHFGISKLTVYKYIRNYENN